MSCKMHGMRQWPGLTDKALIHCLYSLILQHFLRVPAKKPDTFPHHSWIRFNKPLKKSHEAEIRLKMLMYCPIHSVLSPDSA